MPAIRDLQGIRCALPDTVCVGAGAVARDDLHSAMALQPRREGRGLAIGQKVDHPVALQIDQDGAVVLAAPPGPVIDRQHARRNWRGRSRAMHQAQQGIGAGRHGQPPGKAGSCLPAQSKTELALHLGQPCAATCRARRDGSQGLGKGLTRGSPGWHSGTGAPGPGAQHGGPARAGPVADAGRPRECAPRSVGNQDRPRLQPARL
jgi:hypothetical protein